MFRLLSHFVVGLTLITSSSTRAVHSQLQACHGVERQEEGLYATMGFFTDSHCQNIVNEVNYYSPVGTCSSSGQGFCYPIGVNLSAETYGKLLYAAPSLHRLDITDQQHCTYGQESQALFATFHAAGEGCVHLRDSEPYHGVVAWLRKHGEHEKRTIAEPSGGALHPAYETGDFALPYDTSSFSHQKRENAPKCSGFRANGQNKVSSASVKVSRSVLCPGYSTPCRVTVSSDEVDKALVHVQNSYWLNSHKPLGYFNVRSNFAEFYTDRKLLESDDHNTEMSFYVSPGQTGYIAAYYSGLLFHGNFTDCDEALQEDTGGQVMVLTSPATLNVVLTNMW